MGLLKTLWKAHPVIAILAVILTPVLMYFMVCFLVGTALGVVMHVGISLLIICIAFVAVKKLFFKG
jgi:hypothetical protein